MGHLTTLVYLRRVKPTIPDNLRGAFDYCARVTHGHYENFPVASWLLPHRIRPYVYSIYAFARAADDFADEPGLEPDERLAKLDEWDQRLANCIEKPEGPVFEALGETIRVYEIPHSLFEDLLAAFRQDVRQSRHQTFDDLLAYSSLSANPVGRLVLTLFGQTDLDLFAQSDAICTGLQLTNFWQDIAVDYARDRVYLPQAEMASHGVDEQDLAAKSVSPALRSLLKDLIGRTRDLFVAGSPLLECVTGRLRYELRLTWLGGSRILDEIERVDYDVLNHRPTLTRWMGLRLLARSLHSVRVHE